MQHCHQKPETTSETCVTSVKAPQTPTSQERKNRIFGEVFFKTLIESALLGELNYWLTHERRLCMLHGTAMKACALSGNFRNGFSLKTIRTTLGPIRVRQPRDRLGRFVPKIIPKHRRIFSINHQQILEIWAHGQSLYTVQSQLYDLYESPVSFEVVNAVANEVMNIIRRWQTRPITHQCAKLYVTQLACDITNHYQQTLQVVHMRTPTQEIEVLGVWKTSAPTRSHWYNVLISLKNRGLSTVPVAKSYESPGLDQAFKKVFPNGTLTIVSNEIPHL